MIQTASVKKPKPSHIVRVNEDNFKQIQEWIQGFRVKVSINNAANMFMAEGIATVKKQGAK